MGIFCYVCTDMINIKRFTITAAIVASLTAWGAVPSIITLMDEAGKAQDKGDWKLAEEKYKEIVAAYPTDEHIPWIMSNIAIMQSYQGNDSLALATLDDAHERQPRSITILENRALIRNNTGNEKGAYEDFARILEIDSLHWQARYLHGMIALNRRDTVMAEKDFTKVAAQMPESEEAHIGMAALYTAKKDYPAAIKEYDWLLARKQETDFYVNRAACLLTLDRLDEASADITEGLRINPDDGELYLLRAWLNNKRFRPDEAKADGNTAIRLGVSRARVEKTLERE